MLFRQGLFYGHKMDNVPNCLPPWFDTHIVVNPHSNALTASSGRHIPLDKEACLFHGLFLLLFVFNS